MYGIKVCANIALYEFFDNPHLKVYCARVVLVHLSDHLDELLLCAQVIR